MSFLLPGRSRRSSALVIALLGITLVSILALTLFLVSRYERKAASLALGKANSETLADLAADLAILRLKEATEDGLSAGKMWVSEPGRIRVYQRTNLTQFVDYPLFSALPGADTTLPEQNNVDLNKRSFDGRFPIAPPAPGNTQATMKVGWIALSANPTQPTSSSNPIAGRIAFWVDDESCKVNINTADGSRKDTVDSYGFGTPSEISLAALQDAGGTPLSQSQASAIADFAWTNGFNSAAEIGRVAGVPDGFFEANKFNLTHFNKTPELTFYGEPRLYLMPVAALANVTYSLLTGPQFPQASAVNQLSHANIIGERIDFVYPTSRQLPHGATGIYNYPSTFTYLADNLLPQYPLGINGQILNRPQSTDNNRSANFPFAYRIAQALEGRDSKDQPFDWPSLGDPGASPATKYNVRQRDSLALQILDISNNTVFADHARAFSLPTLSSGILGTAANPSARVALVSGLGRSPKLTEVFVSADIGSADPFGNGHAVGYVQPKIVLEFLFPKTYEGVPLDNPYAGSDVTQWRMGNKKIFTRREAGVYGWSSFGLNEQDIGEVDPSDSGSPGDPSPLDPTNYWSNNMLHIPGVDLAGNRARTQAGDPLADPDQTSAALHHAPYAAFSAPDGTQKYRGVRNGIERWPLLLIWQPSATTSPWPPGAYHSVTHRSNGVTPFFGSVGQTQFPVSGGVAFRSHTASGEFGFNWELAPLDALRGNEYTNENPATIKADLLKAVIPINFTPPGSYVARVADPLVNKFPGDWMVDADGSDATLMEPTGSVPAIYGRGGDTLRNAAFPSIPTASVTNSDGDNPEFRPSAAGGDPLSLWLPRQDVRHPKQSRFPSVGALNFIRTGMIPDDLSVPLENQKGVPFRSLNLTKSSSQGSYPDWAMLDLFTVPFIPQPVFYNGEDATPKRRLTSGGATEGKLNINNPKIPFPFGQTIPGVTQIPPVRTAPLEALFLGIKTSTAYSNSDPVYTTISANDAQDLRQAVQDRLAAQGPFVLPGQLAEVPEIDAYSFTGVAANAVSRNDLMRQVVGATTTQSNVFSVWVVAQSIKKNPKNSNPAAYEDGDTITGETRRRYLIERHIDYGKDGVPGNAVNPGPDGLIGTEDDPIDANYHPALTYPLPYTWKILAVENTTS